ncbi:MAG: hypothetical protein N3H31_06550 [Candidatus Nezhaarchaeota archaeon]|nr:hypothetical protein [Candidatus Nezhaarchaeota archaeon]
MVELAAAERLMLVASFLVSLLLIMLAACLLSRRYGRRLREGAG